jgi:hypothetical protein
MYLKVTLSTLKSACLTALNAKGLIKLRFLDLDRNP